VSACSSIHYTYVWLAVTFESKCDTTIDLVSFEQNLREMFELYDDDGSGGIDQLELRALMAQLGVDLTDEELSVSAIAMS